MQIEVPEHIWDQLTYAVQVGLEPKVVTRDEEIEALARDLFIRIPLEGVFQGGDGGSLLREAEKYIDARDEWRKRRQADAS